MVRMENGRSRCAVLMATLIAGCGAHHTAAWEARTPLAQSAQVGADAKSILEAGDAHWERRAERTELEAAIASWVNAVAANPSDWETLTKLARAAYLLADGHLAFEGEAKQGALLAMYERGMGYAERAMVAASAEFKRRVEAGEPIESAIGVLDRRSVGALYWYTTNLGKWANAQGFTTVLKHKSKIKKFIEACRVLDESYFYAAPDRYLGVIYAKAPAIAGGDMKLAKEHFERSLKAFPGYLATRVLWAEFYAVKAEDRDGFKRELEFVLAQPDDVIPELVAETRIEKRKAERLLAQIEERF